MKKVALVIGNKDYCIGQLSSPLNDANDMANSLKDLGFSVILKENLSKMDFKQAIYNFENEIDKNGTALFYYSGHGMQYEGTNYLLPVDVTLEKEYFIEDESIKINMILEAMNHAKSTSNILLIDACRDNPFSKNFKSLERGLGESKTTPPFGTIIFYATSPGKVAIDGNDNKKHSIYTKTLLTQIKKENQRFEDLVISVTTKVEEETQGKQIPWIEGILRNVFYFNSTEVKNNLFQENIKKENSIGIMMNLTKYEKMILEVIYALVHDEGNIEGKVGFEYSKVAEYLQQEKNIEINSSQVHSLLINLKDKGFIKAEFTFGHIFNIILLQDVSNIIQELNQVKLAKDESFNQRVDYLNTLKMKKSSILEKLGYMYQKEIKFADGAKKYEMKQEIKELEQELQEVEKKLTT
ncbi:MAG: caspase family protein [Leptospiraceae bacterium]|nr:caspase family protein [Leptospiraceae bacterium]MCP5494757.1 caspase family protein [Leptospiraceae bacterium]